LHLLGQPDTFLAAQGPVPAGSAHAGGAKDEDEMDDEFTTEIMAQVREPPCRPRRWANFSL
jgi:hypothetical protein